MTEWVRDDEIARHKGAGRRFSGCDLTIVVLVSRGVLADQAA
jgi:hypothetical protein